MAKISSKEAGVLLEWGKMLEDQAEKKVARDIKDIRDKWFAQFEYIKDTQPSRDDFLYRLKQNIEMDILKYLKEGK